MFISSDSVPACDRRTGRLKMQEQKMEDKKDERTENTGLKMQDQTSGGENAGTKNARLNVSR